MSARWIAAVLVGATRLVLASPAGIPLGTEASIAPDTEYAVAGTMLRLRLTMPQRANLPGGGHAWSGSLHVCERASCVDLGLVGPDRPATAWHGYAFQLVFVDPTSLVVRRAPDAPATRSPRAP